MTTTTEHVVLKVGDEVRVFDVNGNRLGQPEGGWVGTVTKVGRKLVTIQTGDGYNGEKQYRLEDQMANDNYGHRRFKTLEQAAQDERRAEAMDVLRNAGINFGYRAIPFTVDQLEELAALVQSWTR